MACWIDAAKESVRLFDEQNALLEVTPTVPIEKKTSNKSSHSPGHFVPVSALLACLPETTIASQLLRVL